MDDSMMTNALPKGTVLNGIYNIIKVLGSGGFGITYLAWRMHNEQKHFVAIKEYFLENQCTRNGQAVISMTSSTDDFENGQEFFVAQAQRLKGLAQEHPNIVNIGEIFYANNTAYYTMEYVPGRTLRYLVEKKRNGFPYRQEVALNIMAPVLKAVDMLHRNRITHLDIKPDNIMVSNSMGTEGNRAVLIGFDLSKHYDQFGRSTAQSDFLACTDGFAPPEQYSDNAISRFSQESDVYSLAATLYFLLNGNNPPIACEVTRDKIVNGLPINVSPQVKEAIANAMDPSLGTRTSTVRQFAQDLGIDTYYWEGSTTDQHLEQPIVPIVPPKPKSNLPISTIMFAAVVALAASLLIWWVMKPKPKTSDNLSFNVNGVDFEMVLVKGVHVPGIKEIKDYYMGQTEVTRALWDAVMGHGPAGMLRYENDGQLPVTTFSRKELTTFLQRLNQLTSKNFRLPTPMEWNFASLGGQKTMKSKYAGGDNANDVGWHIDNSRAILQDVGTKAPNSLGLYDMSGNASELVIVKIEGPQAAKLNPQLRKHGMLKSIGDNVSGQPVPLSKLKRENFNSQLGDAYVGLRLALDRQPKNKTSKTTK